MSYNYVEQQLAVPRSTHGLGTPDCEAGCDVLVNPGQAKQESAPWRACIANCRAVDAGAAAVSAAGPQSQGPRQSSSSGTAVLGAIAVAGVVGYLWLRKR